MRLKIHDLRQTLKDKFNLEYADHIATLRLANVIGFCSAGGRSTGRG